MPRFSPRVALKSREQTKGFDSVLIRPAHIGDVPAILGIEHKIESAGHWTEEKYREIFKKGIPRRVILVAEVQSDVRGFGVIKLLRQECEIENLAVSSQVRGQGIGTHLLSALLDLARKEGALTAFLEVRESNVAARALYNEAGFKENGCRKSYYQSPGEDAILYVRAVSQ